MEQKVFPERAEELDDETFGCMDKCMKRSIPIRAVQIYEPFRVKTLGGDYKQGKPGDYLMCGIDGELYICDKDIFERSYNWL